MIINYDSLKKLNEIMDSANPENLYKKWYSEQDKEAIFYEQKYAVLVINSFNFTIWINVDKKITQESIDSTNLFYSRSNNMKKTLMEKLKPVKIIRLLEQGYSFA